MHSGKKVMFREEEDMIKRGEMYLVNLNPIVGSEQGGKRPVLIIQNDIGNRHSSTVIAAAVTARITKGHLPTHVEIAKGDENGGLLMDSVILLEQIRTLDKERLIRRIGQVPSDIMDAVDSGLVVSLGIGTEYDDSGEEQEEENVEEN